MSSASRGTVYSLIAIVCVLLVGITALLGVAYHRHQRLEDMTIDLQRHLSQQEGQIKALQQRLENCDTVKADAPVDSAWRINPTAGSTTPVKRRSRWLLRQRKLSESAL